jgi:hypothetical protein
VLAARRRVVVPHRVGVVEDLVFVARAERGHHGERAIGELSRLENALCVALSTGRFRPRRRRLSPAPTPESRRPRDRGARGRDSARGGK